LPLQLLQPGCLSRARRLQALELTTQLALALVLDLTQLRLQLGNAPLAGAAGRLARVLARTLGGVLAVLAQRLQLLLRTPDSSAPRPRRWPHLLGSQLHALTRGAGVIHARGPGLVTLGPLGQLSLGTPPPGDRVLQRRLHLGALRARLAHLGLGLLQLQ